MKIVIQRVLQACVMVAGTTVGAIEEGVVVFVGVTHGDTPKEGAWLAKKLAHLRLFQDAEGKMNLSLGDKQAKALIVSQFTLYANCLDGRRPSFLFAADPVLAEDLYNKFICEVQRQGINTQSGIFGADMQVSLVNDGPVTFILEKTPDVKI